MDSARTWGPALQMDMDEVGHERSAACLVSGGELPRREYYSCSLPAETRRGRACWERDGGGE
jgi:hypothetical protein